MVGNRALPDRELATGAMWFRMQTQTRLHRGSSAGYRAIDTRSIVLVNIFDNKCGIAHRSISNPYRVMENEF